MSGWMVGEWGGDSSELASAQLNLHHAGHWGNTSAICIKNKILPLIPP